MNGEDGLGAIYPAMANSVMMYDVLGFGADHPDRAMPARRRSKSCWSSRTTKPIASLASRRCGTRRWSATALMEAGEPGRRTAWRAGWHGLSRCRCWT